MNAYLPLFFSPPLGNRARLFQTEVSTAKVSSRLFKGIVVICAATAAPLITQKELYASRNNRCDWVHSPNGVGLQQPGLFNRWYLSHMWSLSRCSLRNRASFKSNSLSGRAGSTPGPRNLLHHTVHRQGCHDLAASGIQQLRSDVHRHFHLKKNNLIHMWVDISALKPPTWFFFKIDTIVKLA